MSYRTLAWGPAAIAFAALVAELAIGKPQAVHVAVEAAKILWLAGMLAAASGFERGDYLRRGWLSSALAVGLFLVRDLTLISRVDAAIAASVLGVVRGVLIACGNAAFVWGVFLMVRVWRAADLDDAVRGRGRVLFGAAIAAAVLLTGPSIAHDAMKCFSGHLDAVPHLASDLGDAIGFVLLAALIRTALALRGGVVFWVWMLFSIGQLSWILFDGARTLMGISGAADKEPFVELLRVIGALYFGAAGLAQRWVVRARFPIAHLRYN